MNKKTVLLSAAVAGILGTQIGNFDALAYGDHGKKKTAKFKCDGGNACGGHSACTTATTSCSGQNSCAGKGWIYVKNKKECDEKRKQVKKMMETKASKKKTS